MDVITYLPRGDKDFVYKPFEIRIPPLAFFSLVSLFFLYCVGRLVYYLSIRADITT